MFPAGRFYRFRSEEEKPSMSSLQSRCQLAADAQLSVRRRGGGPGDPGRAARKGSRVPARMRNSLGAWRPSAPSPTCPGFQCIEWRRGSVRILLPLTVGLLAGALAEPLLSAFHSPSPRLWSQHPSSEPGRGGRSPAA